MAGTNFKIQIINQGGYHIAYSHTIDISTIGKSEEEARQNFAELAAVYEGITAPPEDRTAFLVAELLKNGWTQKGKRLSSPTAKATALEAKRRAQQK
jgi:hypothetical protein